MKQRHEVIGLTRRKLDKSSWEHIEFGCLWDIHGEDTEDVGEHVDFPG